MTESSRDSVVLSLRGSCLDIAQDLADKLKALPAGQRGVELRRLLESRPPSDDWRGSVLALHVPIVARVAAILGLREPATLIDTIAERYVDWSLVMPYGAGRATMDAFPAGALRGVVGEHLLRRLNASKDHSALDKAFDLICVLDPREAVGAMEEMLIHGTNLDARRHLVQAMGSRNLALDTILRLHDSDPELRFNCRIALGGSGEPSVLPKLLSSLASEEPIGAISALLAHKSKGAGAAVLEAAMTHSTAVLAELIIKDELWPDISGLRTKPLVDRLLEDLKDKNKRFLASRLLAVLGADEAIEPLLALLRSENRDTRATAAWALGRLKAVLAVDTLTAVACETECASTALAVIRGREAIPALITILARGRYDAHRIEAARALGKLGGNEAEAALLKALKEKSPWARTAVLDALYAMKATTVGPIIAALKDKEPSVRAEAARVIGGLAGSEVGPRLLTMIGDEQARDGAILGLWRLAWRDC